MTYLRIYPQIPPNYHLIVHSVSKTRMALWTHHPYLSPFFQLSFFDKRSQLYLPNHLLPLIQTFPSGDHFPFFLIEHLPMTHSGMHAPIQNDYINAHMFNSLPILFTSGIWFSCVQVLDHHTSAQPLQVVDERNCQSVN